MTSLRELQTLAKAKGVKYISNMRKSQLCVVLGLAHENSHRVVKVTLTDIESDEVFTFTSLRRAERTFRIPFGRMAPQYNGRIIPVQNGDWYRFLRIKLS